MKHAHQRRISLPLNHTRPAGRGSSMLPGRDHPLDRRSSSDDRFTVARERYLLHDQQHRAVIEFLMLMLIGHAMRISWPIVLVLISTGCILNRT